MDNAFTSDDHTVYFENTGSRHIDLLLMGWKGAERVLADVRGAVREYLDTQHVFAVWLQE